MVDRERCRKKETRVLGKNIVLENNVEELVGRITNVEIIDKIRERINCGISEDEKSQMLGHTLRPMGSLRDILES